MTRKIPLNQPLGGSTHQHRVRRGKPLEVSRNIRGLTKRQPFVPAASSYLAHDDQSRVDAQAHGESNALRLFQTRFQRAQGLENAQSGTYGSRRIVFMRLRIAKVDQQAIAEILRNSALEVLDDLRAGCLVGPYDLAVVLEVEPARQPRRIHYITEKH